MKVQNPQLQRLEVRQLSFMHDRIKRGKIRVVKLKVKLKPRKICPIFNRGIGRIINFLLLLQRTARYLCTLGQ